MKVGIVGCGKISQAYLAAAPRFAEVEVVAVADIIPEVARARAREFAVEPWAVDELIRSKDIEVIVNLTIPSAHVAVGLAALEAGKHVYSEKPIAIDLASSRALLRRATERGLRVGCAPDTVLGAGLQTARHHLDSGAIGRPLSGTASMLTRGPERFHANPGFFYQPGAGPMFDMGPYYLTTLFHLFGPVKTVMGSTSRGFEERICENPTLLGKRIPVEVPTHYAGVLEFATGPIITVTISFDVHAHRLAPMEIYGTEGSMVLPDPNCFDGEPLLYRPEAPTWEPPSITHHYSEPSRIIGLVDMIEGLRDGRVARCDGDIAHHVLEVMLAFEQSSIEGRRITVESAPRRPPPLPPGYRFLERRRA